MNSCLTFAFLLIVGTNSFLFINGHWLQGMRSMDNPDLGLPDEIVLNGDIMKCGTVLKDAEKCSCFALMCDGKAMCEHQTKPVRGYRFLMNCRLTKSWNDINKEAATFGGPSDDCYCMAKAMKAVDSLSS